jgi:hypothetical protein
MDANMLGEQVAIHIDRCLQHVMSYYQRDEGAQRNERVRIIDEFNGPPAYVRPPPGPPVDGGDVPPPGPPLGGGDVDPGAFIEDVFAANPIMPTPVDVRQTDFDDASTVLFKRLPCRSSGLSLGNTQAEQIRARTAKNGVFFYPACGFDLEPLVRFSGVCDTFIYCDSGVTEAGFMQHMHHDRLQLLGSQWLPPELVDCLAYPTQPQGLRNLWGRRLFFSCPAANPQRLLQLWYFSIEGATLYQGLFKLRNWAPEYLCIKDNPAGWEVWRQPLGINVNGRSLPKFVASEDGTGQDHNWPWTQHWLTFNTWPGEFPEPVHLYHLPQIAPTEQEYQKFRLPEIPEAERPLRAGQP